MSRSELTWVVGCFVLAFLMYVPVTVLLL